MVRTYPGLQVFQHQADAVLDQANPVSGTKYVVLDTVRNTRIIGIMAQCTWTVQPTPLEVHLMLDGIPYTAAQTDPVTITAYALYFSEAEAQPQLSTSLKAPTKSFLCECRSIKVEAEITGGTVSNLTARVKWAKL